MSKTIQNPIIRGFNPDFSINLSDTRWKYSVRRIRRRFSGPFPPVFHRRNGRHLLPGFVQAQTTCRQRTSLTGLTRTLHQLALAMFGLIFLLNGRRPQPCKCCSNNQRINQCIQQVLRGHGPLETKPDAVWNVGPTVSNKTNCGKETKYCHEISTR